MVTTTIKEILEIPGKYFAKINIGYQVKPWQIKEGQMYVGMLQKQVFLEALAFDKFDKFCFNDCFRFQCKLVDNIT